MCSVPPQTEEILKFHQAYIGYDYCFWCGAPVPWVPFARCPRPYVYDDLPDPNKPPPYAGRQSDMQK